MTTISIMSSAPIKLTMKEPCESWNKLDLDQICLKIIVPMFNHFYTTSNLGDVVVSNELLHVCLFKHLVACNFETIKMYLPMLGWFNDEHCQFDMNKSLICMWKLSCNICIPF